MALSRFWLVILIGSIVYVFILLLTGANYSIDHVVNGKKDDPIVIKELYITSLPAALQDSLVHATNHTVTTKGTGAAKDTIYKAEGNVVKVTSGKQTTDGLLPTIRNMLVDLILPLLASLAFFSGILQLLIDSGASQKLSRGLSPVLVKVFPEIPANHPSLSYMMLNFAANFLGLDSAATPFGLKAMESLQEINPDKDRASNAQIMFMCLHAAGLTLLPTSIIGYRAAQNAHNPADVMLPCIITSFIGTIAAMVMVGVRQKIQFKSATLLLSIGVIAGIITGLLIYITRLDLLGKNHFTNNTSNIILLCIILGILVFSFLHEKVFSEKGINVYASFVEGASDGLKTGVKIFPYILGMLAAISIFRNSGLFEIISGGLAKVFLAINIRKDIVDALPVAMLRPFSSGGSRGFMIDSMQIYGPDSFTGRLSCVFQCSAETTFYVIAVYFGSVKIKNTRYTLPAMLLTDLVCVITAIIVCMVFF